MTKYSITRRSAIHTGGTKFYSVYLVQRGSESIVLNHFGKVALHKRPRAGGQSAIQADAGSTFADGEVKRKTKSGYVHWELDEFSFNRAELAEHFGNRLADQIDHHMTWPDSVEPETAAEQEPTVYETAGDASWGSW